MSVTFRHLQADSSSEEPLEEHFDTRSCIINHKITHSGTYVFYLFRRWFINRWLKHRSSGITTASTVSCNLSTLAAGRHSLLCSLVTCRWHTGRDLGYLPQADSAGFSQGFRNRTSQRDLGWLFLIMTLQKKVKLLECIWLTTSVIKLLQLHSCLCTDETRSAWANWDLHQKEIHCKWQLLENGNNFKTEKKAKKYKCPMIA